MTQRRRGGRTRCLRGVWDDEEFCWILPEILLQGIHHTPIFTRTLALRSHHRKPPIPLLYSAAYNSSRSLYPHIPESYPLEDEDEGLEYMKGTEHPPNECDRSGIDDVLELASGDSPPGVNEFVADPDWEPPLVARPATRIGRKHGVYEQIPTYNCGKPLT
ncbi:hypothetical protein B0H13DRAFT_1860946 [Mycena leptocephala]|nr:hypothetical protein B0H13DRAFT_1860946 [Mycena leptocephala]